MSKCEHEWHIEGRDIFVQCWHNLEHTLTVEQVEAILNEHAVLKRENRNLRDIISDAHSHLHEADLLTAEESK